MPKTLLPGVAEVAGGKFVLAVKPDVFDGRDLEYRPQLRALPAVMDARPEEHFVLTQEGNSCTGHALAAMINTVLASDAAPIRVSPYMLYAMARRYDEFERGDDVGSSLRGALKGWFYQGVLPETDWSTLAQDIDVDLDPVLRAKALRHPLGAFYRINAFRIDDMQSAINELRAIAVSAQVHSGWLKPRRMTKADGTHWYLIDKPAGAAGLGGHAFVIAGYNDVGFLVQNSWGSEWGGNGFATLPYGDWLQSAFDAWVARPGVPSLVDQRNATQVATATSGTVSQGPGPDLARLRGYVVNVGNNGLLSTTGRFTSSPAQLEMMVAQMKDTHDGWASEGGASAVRRVVLYAHGGLVTEDSGLAGAQAQLNWWLNNKVYPIFFAWQSGPVERSPTSWWTWSAASCRLACWALTCGNRPTGLWNALPAPACSGCGRK